MGPGDVVLVLSTGACRSVAFMGLFTQDAVAPNFMVPMTKGASLRGTAMGSAAAYRDLLALVEEHSVKPPNGRAFAFEDAGDAYRALASPDAFGKVVTRITE